MIELTIRLPRDPGVPETISQLTMVALNIGGTLSVRGLAPQVTGEVGIGDIVAQSRQQQGTPPEGHPIPTGPGSNGGRSKTR